MNHDFSKDINDVNFLNNVQVVQKKLSEKYINVKDVGILVWMIKEAFFKIEKKEYNTGDYKAGDKLKNIELKIERINSYETHYGWMVIYTMVDKTNCKFTWFTSAEITKLNSDGIEISSGLGDDVVFTSAKVKEIKIDEKYENSVILTNCRRKKLK